MLKNGFFFLSVYSLHSKEEELRTAQSEFNSLNEQLNAERIKQQQQADLIKRLQRKLLLVTKVMHYLLQLHIYTIWLQP